MNHCIQCQKTYDYRATPVHAFDAALNHLGTTHVGCGKVWTKDRGLGYEHAHFRDPETGRRILWLRRVAQQPIAIHVLFVDWERRDQIMRGWSRDKVYTPGEIDDALRVAVDLNTKYERFVDGKPLLLPDTE